MASATHTTWAAIEQRLSDNWPYTQIAWPGVDFDPSATNDWWLRVTPRFGDSSMESMTTGGYNLIVGILYLDLFDKTGNGYGILRERADELRDLFDRQDVGAASFRAASGPEMIRNERGWLHLQVRIPFWVHETS